MASATDIVDVLRFFRKQPGALALGQARQHFGVSTERLLQWLAMAGVREQEVRLGAIPEARELWQRLRPSESQLQQLAAMRCPRVPRANAEPSASVRRAPRSSATGQDAKLAGYAEDLEALIPLIEEIKANKKAKTYKVSDREGVPSSFDQYFEVDGSMKPAAANRSARALHRKLEALRQSPSHSAVVTRFDEVLARPGAAAATGSLAQLDEYADELNKLIPLIEAVKNRTTTIGAIATSEGGPKSLKSWFKGDGTLRPADSGPKALSFHKKLDAIRGSHRDAVARALDEVQGRQQAPPQRGPRLRQPVSSAPGAAAGLSGIGLSALSSRWWVGGDGGQEASSQPRQQAVASQRAPSAVPSLSGFSQLSDLPHGGLDLDLNRFATHELPVLGVPPGVAQDQEVSSLARPQSALSTFGGDVVQETGSWGKTGYQAAQARSLAAADVRGTSAPEIVDVDDYPSPQVASVSAAQRLASDPWLRDDDLAGFTEWIATDLAGRPRFEMLSFAHSQDVELLAQGDQVAAWNRGRQQDALRRLRGPDAPPILFLPVNHANSHWSLLVVDLRTQEALHYDSMVPPASAHLATDTLQYGVASQVANSLGVRPPVGMPIRQQKDTHSCGDHVLYGIEALARRAVSGALFVAGGMDLSVIQPSRDRIVDLVTRNEQYNRETRAAPVPQAPRDKAEERSKTQNQAAAAAPAHVQPASPALSGFSQLSDLPDGRPEWDLNTPASSPGAP